MNRTDVDTVERGRYKVLVTEYEHLSPEELERLMADLEARVYDGQLRIPPGAEPSPPPKFSDLNSFDVVAWAKRRGITLPER